MSENKEICRIVVTQAEFDEAVAENIPTIYIESPEGRSLTIRNTGSSRVIARGSSHVEARELSHVIAWGSSHVEAWESSHVEAWESSRVIAWGSSHVEARGSSHVEAWESSRVEARELSHVEAWESSHIEASTYTAVHIHSQKVTLNSTGAVVDCTAIDLSNVAIWCDYYGIKINDGKAIVYKGVDNDLVAGHHYISTTYSIGETVTASDWKNTTDCGYGLHFSPSPAATKNYYPTARRFLACEIDLENLVPLGDKCKAPSARVLHEVDVFGNRLEDARLQLQQQKDSTKEGN